MRGLGVFALAILVALACGNDSAAADRGRPMPVAVGPGGFSPDAIAPYFPDVAAKMAAGDWTGARDGFAALLAAPEGGDRPQLRFLVATCDSRLRRFAEAAAGFDAAAAQLPLLADYARYEAARAYYFTGELDRAMDRLGGVASDSVMDTETRLLRGDILRRRGSWSEVAKTYEDYLATYPKGMRLAEARFRLAEAKEELGRPVPDALRLYKQIMVEAPLEAWSGRAKERFDVLSKRVRSKRARKTLMQMTAEEYVTRGMQYFDGMRNSESEADFTAALGAPGLGPELRCVAVYHRAQSVFKQRTRCKSAPLFEAAVAACEKVENPDLQVRSAYQAGRGYMACNNDAATDQAIALFDRAETWHPEHSFADDARLRQAEAWERKIPTDPAAKAKIEDLLSTLPDRYPDGDMRAEALWRLAWRDWLAKDYPSTIRWLDLSLAKVPRDYNYWAEGQPHYWKARALEKLGKKDAARAAYERCVREYPLSYYALHALNRLREGHRPAFDRLVAELKATPAGWQAGSPAFSFTPRTLYGAPGFGRAVELVRLGLGGLAEREFSRLGLRPQEGKRQVKDADLAEKLWATALLYDRAGLYDRSHWIARWHVLDYKDSWPTEANRLRWEIAYPKAWWQVLEPAAAGQGYPAELILAFVREESAFDPIRESFANAIGLTQMIFPTARRFGDGLGFEITRENLRDPVKNVAIGSRFLGFLMKTFDRRLGLVVPAYNAGEGAVWKFLCQRGTWALDEFAEAIPYDETRLYSKRVLSTYFTYAWLRDGTIPEMSNDIPSHVINEKRCRPR